MQDPSSALSPNSDRRRDSDESRLLNVKYKKKASYWKEEAERRETVALTYRSHLSQFVTLVDKLKEHRITDSILETDESEVEKYNEYLDAIIMFSGQVVSDVLSQPLQPPASPTVGSWKEPSVRDSSWKKESGLKKFSEGVFGLLRREDSLQSEESIFRPHSIIYTNPFNSMYSFQSLYKNLPKQRVTRINGSEITSFIGPDTDSPSQFAELACAHSISTYPHLPTHPKREGDPICDRYSLSLYDNRVIACVADGCNWGTAPREAALNATVAFTNFLKTRAEEIVEVKDAGPLLIKAYASAHEAIIYGKEMYDAGTTTLLGGILLENDRTLDPNCAEYEFVCASVGDCKAFMIRGDELSEITVNNRGNIDNPSDCGGRLGPHLEGGHPDLRNLMIFNVPCYKDDLIFLVTDGVHDNLDPGIMGIGPKALGLEEDNWKAVPLEKGQVAKNEFMLNLLREKLHGVRDPSQVVIKIIEHCVHLTQPSREFMESNVGKKLSTDYALFPGKMDHTTVLCFRVGQANKLIERKKSTGSENNFQLRKSANNIWKPTEKGSDRRTGFIGRREKRVSGFFGLARDDSLESLSPEEGFFSTSPGPVSESPPISVKESKDEDW